VEKIIATFKKCPIKNISFYPTGIIIWFDDKNKTIIDISGV